MDSRISVTNDLRASSVFMCFQPGPHQRRHFKPKLRSLPRNRFNVFVLPRPELKSRITYLLDALHPFEERNLCQDHVYADGQPYAACRLPPNRLP